jgi:hypothetical protein
LSLPLQDKVRLKRLWNAKQPGPTPSLTTKGVGPGCLRFSKSNHGALIQLLHQMHI